MSQRAGIMLSLVLDIKNNKRKDKANGPAAVLSPGVVAWLKRCHVGHVQLKGLTWQKLLSSSKKVSERVESDPSPDSLLGNQLFQTQWIGWVVFSGIRRQHAQ